MNEPPFVDVHLLPRLVEPGQLAGSVTIVVDQLRASTTICQALAAGAECVEPLVEVDQARAAAERWGRQRVRLGGERGGLLIEGFDFGNSPAEYTPATVGGRRIIFTTTNGARALHHAAQARRILVGATVNRRAVVEAAREAAAVHVLCAGTAGEVTHEDVLAAGALVDALLTDAPPRTVRPVAAHALKLWRDLTARAAAAGCTVVDQFALELRDTTGGLNLLEIGNEPDIAWCAQLDALPIVPEFNPQTGEIRPA